MASETLLGEKTRNYKHITDALRKGNSGPLREFLDAGGLVEELGPEGENIYCYPSVVADLELVKLLFERGATLKRELPFFLHICSMSDEVFEWALENNCDKFETDYNVLYDVAYNINRFKRLIERGADIHTFYKKDKTRSLVMAFAGAGFIEQVELIVGKGADINAVWREDWIPLFEALLGSHCNASAIERLVKLGADYRYKRKSGHTAIMITASGIHSAECDLVNKLKYLMSLYQGWAGEVDKDGNSALHIAAKFSFEVDVVSLLLENGFDAKLANKDGKTPIDICIERNEPDLLEPFRRFI